MTGFQKKIIFSLLIMLCAAQSYSQHLSDYVNPFIGASTNTAHSSKNIPLFLWNRKNAVSLPLFKKRTWK
jgi:hypothetical protein